MLPLVSARLLLLIAAITLLAIALTSYYLAKKRKLKFFLCLLLTFFLAISTVVLRINYVGNFVSSWHDLRTLVFSRSTAASTQEVLPLKQAKNTDYRTRFAVVTDKKIWRTELDGELLESTPQGPNSGITNRILVWAPAGWEKMQNLPVVEFLHGYPSAPKKMPQQLELGKRIAAMVENREIPPLLVVMPFWGINSQPPECLDLSERPATGTWIARDVPEIIKANFPASTNPAHWTIAGISAGAYCAGVMHMKAAETFPSAFIFAGYDKPLIGGLTNPKLQAEYTISQLLSSSKKAQIYATAAGKDPDAEQLLKHLEDSVRSQDRITARYSVKGAHNWQTWANDLAQALKWKTALEKGEIQKSSFDISASFPRQKGLLPLVAVLAALSVLSGAGIIYQFSRTATVSTHLPTAASTRPHASIEKSVITGWRAIIHTNSCFLLSLASTFTLLGWALMLINLRTQTVSGLGDISALLALLGF